MRILVIGAVAGGTSAATKARRGNKDAEIVLYEKDTFISYSGCGMPYYLGGEIQNPEVLTPRDATFFKEKYNVDVYTAHEVLSINTKDKSLQVKNLNTGEEFQDTYDKLVVATGARAVIPPIQGADLNHVFTLRNIRDMYEIKEFIDKNQPKSATIIGTGFIGLELTENFKRIGIDVTLVEMQNQVTPALDADMAVDIKEHLKEKGVSVFTGTSAKEVKENTVVLSDGRRITTDFVILATGVRPNIELAKQAGIEIGETGAIKVNKRMETNMKDVFACGDCIEQYHKVTGKPAYHPLGSTANKTGRITGENMVGGNIEFRGILGTGIFRVFDLTVARTGLSEKEAMEEGYQIEIIHNIKPNKAKYMGGKDMRIKAIADKGTGRILGVQITGEEGVDKRIDVFVTAISFGAKAEDLFHLDLAYSPPYSITKDPVMYTGMALDKTIHKNSH